uniref:RNA-directed DNA polymerase n=1 Tax=Strongyloides venezuelensis TaxID=75913 RepID=A0A0K0FQK3_STRVS
MPSITNVPVKTASKGSDHIMTYYQTGPVIDNKFAVILQNHGANTVLIPANTEIGTLHSIEEVDDNTIRISGDEIIPEDAVWEDSLPNYPESHAPLTREQLMDSISWTNCTLSPKAKELLQEIIWNNRTAFFEYDGNAGLYNGDERLNIELATSELPQRIRPGRRSREIVIEIDKKVEDMLEKGMIEPSQSPYLSRVVLVRKKDMKWRFVVDFRAINQLIKQQSHLIPRIDRLIKEASGHKYYSVFDLKQGFHQIPLDEHSRRIAAFVTHRGIYQYKVMPIGLTGSPDKLQDIMNKVLSNIPDCYIYLDDILTCFQDKKSHIRNIDNTLARIAEYNMKITLNKCKFGQKNAQYLGYIIDFDGIHSNPDKVKAITDKREPKTEKEIKSFLGAVSYFRRHIKNFSTLAEPLYRVINSYSWTSAQSDAFKALKKALINAAVLAPPNHTASYTIYTNASFQDLGAALTQKNKSIAFASRSLKPAEKNNPIIKLEVLGLVHALQQFRPYIYGKHAKVVTDYKPLLALLKNKELTGILQRYQMAIMEYDITIVYLKGEDNHVADYLSRTEFNAILLNEDLFEEVFPKNEESNDYSICYRGKRRVLVPKVPREELLRRFHSYPLLGQHFGFDKIADKFCLIFFWPKMLEDMKRIWQNCEVCWKVKHQPTNLAATNTKTIPKPEGIWETLNADYI